MIQTANIQTTAPAITVDGELLSVRFDRFDAASYDLFLRCKRLPEYSIDFDNERFDWTVRAPARFASLLGVDAGGMELEPLPMWADLFDDQQWITRRALQVKRFAIWSDCGLGKTFEESEFARQVAHITGGRVLVFTLNEIVPRWVEMVTAFYKGTFPVVILDTREHMKEWCATGCIDGKETVAKVAITNYEKLNHHGPAEQVVSEMKHLAGIVADESSRLKTGGGKQKWALIKSGRGVEYKLSCTATPAPNEIMEFASQASFLEKMRSENDIIWTYFRRDEKTQKWTVKRHARKAFFEFMSSWSIYVRDPRKYGWRLAADFASKFPPAPVFIRTEIPITAAQRAFVIAHNHANLAADEHTASMFAESGSAITVSKLSQAAKGFYYSGSGPQRAVVPVDSNKPARVAQIVRDELAAGHQVLVWCEFDAETEILAGLLRGIGTTTGQPIQFEVLTGRTKHADRPAIIERFVSGKSKLLLSRADMLGFGQNFQCCTSMVFSGWSFSFEDFYQACRRAWRFGQTAAVRIHLPVVPELEGQMLDAIDRKSRQYEEAVAEMEANYIAAMADLKVIEKGAA